MATKLYIFPFGGRERPYPAEKTEATATVRDGRPPKLKMGDNRWNAAARLDDAEREVAAENPARARVLKRLAAARAEIRREG